MQGITLHVNSITFMKYTLWSRSIFVIINANNFETKHRRPYVLIAKMCFRTVHFV